MCRSGHGYRHRERQSLEEPLLSKGGAAMWKAKRTLGGLGVGMVVMALDLLGGGLRAPAWAQACGDTSDRVGS